MASQVGRQAGSLPGDSATFQTGSAISQESLASQAGKQAGAHLPGDSAASGSAVSRGGSSLVPSQAGRFPSQGQHYFPGRQHNLLGKFSF